jgi:hypothetical protein
MRFFKKDALLAGIQQKNGSTYTKRRRTASKLHLLNKKPKEPLTMDIKKIGFSPSLPSVGQNQETKKGSDFQRILQKANQSVDALKVNPSIMNAPPIQPLAPSFEIGPVKGIMEVQPAEQLRTQGVSAAEKTLDLLGKYQQALADPAQSLKQINPLVESLSRKVDHLEKLTQQFSPGDPLQKIIQQVGVVSAAEIAKFNRGDYI